MQKITLPRHGFLYGSCQRLILLSAVVLLGMCGTLVRADQVIYDDTLENGWQDWGWATINYANPTPVYSGSDSISVTMTAWQGLQIYHPDMDSTPYTNLIFWLNGGNAGGQKFQVYGLVHAGSTNNFGLSKRFAIGPLSANTWQQFTVPLTALGAAGLPNFTGFVIQDSTGLGQPTFYVDDISLTTNAIATGVTNAPVSIMVDASSNRLSISPLIYGVAFASSNQLSDLNVPLNRSGGNSETSYNWQINAHNHAADWYFESLPDSPATPGASADDFVANSRNGGAQPMITIPMIGWAPKLGTNGENGDGRLGSYSIAKYGPQTGNDWQWFPDAGNGIGTNSATHTSWLITTNDPNDANVPVDSAFQQGYVRHLTNAWGMSTNGGVSYYLMDNEHSIWQSTHQDVHPVGPTMQEIRDKIFDYAGMVKSNDPNALVCGPEEWGWPGYFNSGYDLQNSGGHDRANNGGWDYMPWLLDQLHQHDVSTGVRLLDVFTLHCYPAEGNVSGNAVDSATELLRNQSTRVFWDTNYVDPSWIDNIIMLIPRMKSWVASYYPGTKIGVTEYNWGAEPSINGATAQADILGIFGREGLDLATRWTTPTNTTPTYKAIKMYRNYDGNKSTFGDTSVFTSVPNPDNLSAFSAVRTADGALTLMVINKDIYNATPVNASLANFNATGIAQRWQLTAANVITRLGDISVTNSTLIDTVPSQSITLYVLPGVSPFSLNTGANASPEQLTIWLNGQAGLAYVLQCSSDLVNWSALATNTLASNSFPFLVSTTNTTMQFYRGLWSH
jgi:hypothetical protein